MQNLSPDPLPTPPDTQSDISTNNGKRSFFKTVSGRVVIPLMALGLSTPIISHAVCLIGSRILKRKMERETELMMKSTAHYAGVDGNGDPSARISLSKEEKKMRKAEMKAHFKRRKEAAQMQREYLRRERALMRKNKKHNARKLRKRGIQESFVGQSVMITDSSDEEELKPGGFVEAQLMSRKRRCSTWFAEKKLKYMAKLKKNRKVGLFLGIGWWGNI
ncbi:hypothetical protein ABW20_dc0105294 [Dactylellina cionopaga]|nr:hypothetical protein ABW20_dc0105294 [Dactylellina cionopaga]